MRYGKQIIGTVAYMGGVHALPEPFVWSWTRMIEFTREYGLMPNEQLHVMRAKISYHAAARNMLVEEFRGNWLCMFDTDLEFEPDTLTRLLYSMDVANVDVITGLYQYKAPPHLPVIYQWHEDGERHGIIAKWERDMRLIEVGSAGAGCLLVKRSVFNRIKNELKEGPFDVIPPFSEDHSFFRRLRKLGIKAYCAIGVHLRHLTYKGVQLEDMSLDGLELSNKIQVEGFN